MRVMSNRHAKRFRSSTTLSGVLFLVVPASVYAQSSVELDTISVTAQQATTPRPATGAPSGSAVVPRRDASDPSGTGSPNGVAPAFAGGQVAQGARLGLLGNTETRKSPFSATSYTEKFIRDQQAANVSQALALDPSVRATQGTGGQLDSFYIRGFPANEGQTSEIAFDGIYGVTPNLRVFTDYAERIEVLRGPSAPLSGIAPNGGVGGVINVVPKRAGQDLTRVTFDYGSPARGGTQLDVARRYGDAREWGVRFVGSLHGGDTPFDRQSGMSGIGYLALDYQGDRFRSWLYVLGQTDRINAVTRPFLLRAGVPVPRAPRGGTNITQPWEFSNVDDFGSLLRMEYDLTDELTVFGDVGGAIGETNRYFNVPSIINAQGDTLTSPSTLNQGTNRLTYDGGVRAKFDTGFVHHALVVSGSVYQEDLTRNLPPAAGSYASNIYNPRLVPYIVPNRIAGHPHLSDATLSGISIVDTMSILEERVLLTAGVRQQYIEGHNYVTNVGTLASTYDKSATTPLVGIVVRPWDEVSLYANYIEGLSRGDVAPAVATNFGEVLAPYVAHQIEAGVKAQFGGLGTGFSAFEITRPIGELNPTTLAFSQSGEQRVRGLEFSIYGELMPGLRALGGLTLLDGTLTKTALAANVGNTPIGVPKVQLNIGGEVDLPWWPGATFEAGVVYTGRQFVDTANTQPLPDWTRLDLGMRYTTLIEGRRTTFRANVINVTGANYWAGVASFGTFFQSLPRTYLLSVSIDM